MRRRMGIHACFVAAAVSFMTTTAAAISHGAGDVGDLAVVRVIAHGSTVCSGAVIARRAVLTAAHCLEDGTPDAVGVGEAGDAEVAVASVHVAPSFDPATLASDVAVLVLASDAPVGPLEMGDAQGGPVGVAGFGDLSPGKGGGTRRRGTSAATGDGPLLLLTPAPALPCIGDSGGPVLLLGEDGVTRVVGVISHGDGACAREAFAVRVTGPVLAFVQPFLDVDPLTSSSCTVSRKSGDAPKHAAAPWLFFFVLLLVLATRRR